MQALNPYSPPPPSLSVHESVVRPTQLSAPPQPYVVVDLEMDRDIPSRHNDEGWHAAPPRAVCAVTSLYAADGTVRETRQWFGDGTQPLDSATEMTPAAVGALLEYLSDRVAGGAVLVTWGGAHSDMRVLALQAEDADAAAAARALALHSVDVGFALLAAEGCLVGLDAAARGAAVGSKSTEASANAPAAWRGANSIARSVVLKHCAHDVSLTALVYAAALKGDGLVPWRTQKGVWRPGKLEVVHASGGARLPTIAECLAIVPKRARADAEMLPRALVGWILQ